MFRLDIEEVPQVLEAFLRDESAAPMHRTAPPAHPVPHSARCAQFMQRPVHLRAAKIQLHDGMRATVKTMRIIHPRDFYLASPKCVHHHPHMLFHAEPETVPAVQSITPSSTSVTKDVPANVQGYFGQHLACGGSC